MELLDLRIHEIDEAAGKALNLNGTQYIIHELSDEGGETLIFPLENIRSGVIQFLAKVFKFRPGSPDYEKRRIAESNGFVLALADIPIAYEEQHYIPGALMKFMRHQEGAFFGHGTIRKPSPIPSTTRSHQDLVRRASQLEHDGDRVAAIKALEQVLELNPLHNGAMASLAEIHEALRQPRDVLALVKLGLSLEPNDVRFYHLAARAHVKLRQPEDALAILNFALQRYAWDWGSWKLKREVLTRFGLADQLKQMAIDINERLDRGRLATEQIRKTVTEAFEERQSKLESFHRDSDKASDLTDALSFLLGLLSIRDPEQRLHNQFVYGQVVLGIGREWRADWVGRAVAFLASSWCLLEPTQAMDVFGGPNAMMQALQDDRPDTHYIKGFSGLFRNDVKAAASGFLGTARLASDNPFAEFGLVLAGRIDSGFQERAEGAMKNLEDRFAKHPLVDLARRLHS